VFFIVVTRIKIEKKRKLSLFIILFQDHALRLMYITAYVWVTLFCIAAMGPNLFISHRVMAIV
jgi:hypothetical protein